MDWPRGRPVVGSLKAAPLPSNTRVPCSRVIGALPRLRTSLVLVAPVAGEGLVQASCAVSPTTLALRPLGGTDGGGSPPGVVVASTAALQWPALSWLNSW